MTDLLAERIRIKRLNAEIRAEKLRNTIPVLAQNLFQKGATKVVLFGSLVNGSSPHPDTDIDLCVWDLDEKSLGNALLEFEWMVDSSVDIVCWEKASDSLKRRIVADGVEIKP